jgi:hypothetical protein
MFIFFSVFSSFLFFLNVFYSFFFSFIFSFCFFLFSCFIFYFKFLFYVFFYYSFNFLYSMFLFIFSFLIILKLACCACNDLFFIIYFCFIFIYFLCLFTSNYIFFHLCFLIFRYFFLFMHQGAGSAVGELDLPHGSSIYAEKVRCAAVMEPAVTRDARRPPDWIRPHRGWFHLTVHHRRWI